MKTTKSYLIATLITYSLSLITYHSFGQNIGINSTGNSPAASAALDIDMTNKGLLIPRIDLQSLSDATTIASPTASLLVYNTGATLSPAGYYYWSGSAWIPFLTNSAAGNAGWSILGNTGTTAGTNFVGTTDAQDFVLKTGGSEAMRINTSGSVGIGTTTPGTIDLHISKNENATSLWLSSYRDADALGNHFIGFRGRGTPASPTHPILNDMLAAFTGRNYTNLSYPGMTVTASENHSATAQGSHLSFSVVNNGTLTTATAMTIANSGNVGIGTITPSAHLHVEKAFTADATVTGVYANISNTATLTADRTVTSGLFNLYNNQTENGFNSVGHALSGIAYSSTTNTYNWLRGGNFAAYSNSTSATGQDNLVGVLGAAYNNATGTVTNCYGGYNQSFNNSTGTITNSYGGYNLSFTNTGGSIGSSFGSSNISIGNSSGSITTSYGSYNQSHISSSGNITTAFGAYNDASKISGSTGSITTAYGTYSRVNNAHDAAVGEITTACLFCGDVAKATNATNYTTSYGLKLDITAGTTRYGTYITGEHYNYFSGNVGIGTTTPNHRLQVIADGSNNAAGEFYLSGSQSWGNALVVRTSTGASYDGARIQFRSQDIKSWAIGGEHGLAKTGFQINEDAGDALSDAGFGTTRFHISSGGNVGIGTTAPLTKLDVNGGALLRNLVAIGRGTTTWDTQGYELRLNSATGTPPLLIECNSTDLMVVAANGNVGIGTNTPNALLQVNGSVNCTGGTCSSDMRWKDQITTLENTLDNIMKLRGVSYYWKQSEFPDKGFDDRKQIGVIAQEIEKVFPELVTTDSEGFKSMDYMSLSAVLLQAIKELSLQSTEREYQLQQQIDNLKSENQSLLLNNEKTNLEIKTIKTYLGIEAKQ